MPEYKEQVRTYWWYNWKSNELFRYRYDSVPGIHRRRGHIGDHYRYPHTKAELSSGYIADGDEEFLTAAQINKLEFVRGLPVAWDEIPRFNGRNHSWKRFRDTQYHPISIGSLSPPKHN